jgi:hypothetical protein
MGEASDDQIQCVTAGHEKNDLIRALECAVSLGVLECCGPLGGF